MNKKLKWITILGTLILIFFLTACSENQEETADTPAASEDCWANRYVALITSGKAREASDYNSMQAELDQIRRECGATHVYALSPAKDGAPSLDIETVETENFLLTVDGSQDPDDWATEYEWEVPFTEAWNGEPAAARSAWNNDKNGKEQCWSAFAPVYDNNGYPVCILGIDYPCSEVIADYPEWNRDDSSWNGFEDNIEGDVPDEIQAMMDQVTSLAEKYAKQLSYVR